jgi:predicted Rossmann-fold nucleotide-binding protein
MFLKRTGFKMKVIIAGDRKFTDRKVVEKAIKASKFEITEVVSGCAPGVDTVGKEWAKDNKIPVKKFPADWDNIDREGAFVKERVNPWTKKKEKYDAHAGFFRNEQMAMYADALIAVQYNGATSGTQNMIKLAENNNLKVYVYEKPEEEYKYHF